MNYKNSNLFIYALIFTLMTLFSCKSKRLGNPRVLVFSKTSGFHHESIAAGNKAFLKLGLENTIDIDTTTNSDWFIEDSLKNYSAVVFLNTSGDVFNYDQKADFERYIQAGGGYVGVHAAATTEYEWNWYSRLVGGTFKRHPHVQEATLEIKNKKHPSTLMLPETWIYVDEWYDYENINPNVNVLITIDETSYEGASQGGEHAIAWYHHYDGGRAFYTGLGHRDENYSDSLFMSHVLGGLNYAIGDNLKLKYKK